MVVPFFDRVGGYEKQAFNLSQSLIGQGTYPFLLTENFRGLPSFEIRGGVEINRINPSASPFDPGLAFTRYDPDMFFLNRMKDIQIIHCHAWSPLSGQMIKLGRKFGIKSITKVATEKDIGTFRSPAEHVIRENLTFSSEREKESWIKSLNDAFKKIIQSEYFISLNNNITRELINIGISRKRILPISNGVDCEVFCPTSDSNQRKVIRERMGLRNHRTIAFVGRLVERKRCDDLIRAFSMISGEFSDYNLVVVGDGEERGKLEQLASDLSLSERIQFLGERDEIADILKASDLFVFPSRLEGNPNVLLEAMATQLPIITTYIAGHVEFVRHEHNGLLTPAKVPHLLAEKMQYLMGQPDIALKLAKNARETVLEKMSFEGLGKRYTELYEAILKGPVDISVFGNYDSFFKGDESSSNCNIQLVDPGIFYQKHILPRKKHVQDHQHLSGVKLVSPACNLCGGKEHEVVDENNGRLLKGLKIVKCKDCNHIFLNPRIERLEDIHSTTLDYLERCYLKEYTRLGCLDSRKTLLSGKNSRYYLPFIEEISPFRLYNRLLDYGCAIGLFLLAAGCDGWECYGLEMSEMLAEYGQINFNLNIRYGLIEGCDFPPSFFDAITMIETLEHLFDPAAALQKAHELLRKEGVILITTPNFNSLERILARRDWEVYVSDHQHYFSIDTLKKFLDKTHFKIIRLHTQSVNLHEYNARFGYERVKETIEQNGITSENINALYGASIFCLAQKSKNS
jgi:glycosyltransferase involved in cell wall biosynthesis/2-polyprenyl-3-methyl-5-hydroxy-6-metoxy-1,4-benzoquinol methylase